MQVDCAFDEESHVGTIGGRIVPSVTGILKAGGFEPYGSEWHMAKGRAVHLACQYLDEGGLDWSSISDEILPYLMAYELFKKESGFKPTRIEERLFHPTLMFTGQIDRVGEVPNDKSQWLIDIKSGHPGPYCSLQTAGYNLLLPVLKYPRKRFGLHLKENGSYSLIEYKDSQDQGIFLALLAIHNWKKNHGID
jgi:hypothetical protein